MGGVFLQWSEGFVPSPLRGWEDGTRPAGEVSLGGLFSRAAVDTGAAKTHLHGGA